MKYPRKEKLEKYPEYERKAYLQKFIRFNWFIDEHSLLESILRLGLHHSRMDYLVDDDFIAYVFKDVTVNDVLFVADKLDSESNQNEWSKKTGMNYCTKAKIIRSELKNEFYKKYPYYILAHVRRTHCGCHESGSLAKRKDL